MIRGIFALSLILSFVSSSVFAASRSACADLLKTGTTLVSTVFVEQQLQKFHRLSPRVQQRLGVSNVTLLLADPAAPLMRQKLVRILKTLNSRSTVADVNRLLKAGLKWRVPDGQISLRLQNLKDDDVMSLKRALGFKTLAEMQELVYGKNPARPSANSLLGRYLRETHAASLQRRYPRGPNAREGKGGARLTVALSAKHRALFLKSFNFPEIMMHYHTPDQGTLLIFFNGQKISYAGSSFTPMDGGSFRQTGMVIPLILLSTSEAERMTNYVQLARFNRSFAKLPWTLPRYCAAGGYNSCTHWFGEMPIGDQTVDQYIFPGRVDEYATNNAVPANQRGQQKAPLTPYWKTSAYKNLLDQAAVNFGQLNLQFIDPSFLDTPDFITQARYRDVLDQLTRLVWQVPGYQPFADAIGESAAKLRGEFANPGYVLNVLTGRATRTRVPVVFYVQSDDQSLPPGFDLHVNAY